MTPLYLLLPDLTSILLAANPIIIAFIFLSRINNLSKTQKLRLAHKSVFAALAIAACLIFVVFRLAATAYTLISIFMLGGGLVLYYISANFIVRGPKRCQYYSAGKIFPFASPIIAGPATFITTFNCAIRNGILTTLALLSLVMTVVWITLLVCSLFISRRTVRWADKLWVSICLRVIYLPLAFLSLQMVFKGIYRLI